MVTFRRFRTYSGKRVVVYIFLIVAVLVVAGLIRSLREPNSLGTPLRGFSQGDTLDVAVVYGPGSYELRGDTLAGENYSRLVRLRDSLGWPLRMWPVVSAVEALPALAEGRYDIVASLPSDNDLKTKFLTTDEVWLDRLVLVQRPPHGGESRISSALGLAGDTVHVEAGSSAERRLHNLMKEIGDTIYIVSHPSEGDEYLGIQTAVGKYRFAVINNEVAKRLKTGAYPQLDASTPVAFTQFQVWAIRPNDTELLRKLNEAIGN